MKLASLIDFDPSFLLLTEPVAATDIEGITDTSEYLPRHILFIKNKNFLNEFLTTEDALHIGVIIEKKYADLLSADQLEAVKHKALWVGTVNDVGLGMSFISKPLYDEKFKNPNDMVDGRQMGTASVHPSSWVAQGAFIGENVVIEANTKIHTGVVIMSGSRIGENTEIYPNVTIYRNVKIGNNVRIHSQSVIGADGFGYNFAKGIHHKVWHMGGVVIGDNVEIGAGTCIDQGTFSPTKIGNGSKIDNLVQIGHNCKIGNGVIICGQTAMGGSTTVEDYAVLGGNAMIANGIRIGKAAQIAGAAGVTGSLEDGEVVAGIPARNVKEWMKGVAYVRKHSLATKDKSE